MLPAVKRILYATDLSKNSAYAFRYAIQAAILNDAIITILHVMEKIPSHQQSMVEAYLPEPYKENLEKRKNGVINRVRMRLNEFCNKELKDQPQALDRIDTIDVCEGYPAEETLRRSAESNYDLIVMGTHGKGIISQTFLGSVAKQVLRRNRIPVFIVPLPAVEMDITFHDI